MEIATSDDNLVYAAKSGDLDAFGVLFERYRDTVYSFAVKSVMNRDDAEDIVQETFCRAWRSINSFRGDSKLLTWLYRIAANLCADYGRSRMRKGCLEVSLDGDVDNLISDSPVDTITHCINRQAVEEALNKLPMAHRMLVVLCDMQELTAEEAAGIVGCSAISVRVRLSRARKRLRKLLSQTLDEVD